MGLTFARRILTRFPGLRWALATMLQRVPALDRRLRSAVAALDVRATPLRMDAIHVPEDAVTVYRSLVEAIALRRRR